jgi:hypothetical protein
MNYLQWRIARRKKYFEPKWEPGSWSDIIERLGFGDEDCICWIWTGRSQTPNGYGVFNFEGKTVTAHSAAFRLYNPEYFDGIPKGWEVDHICRVRKCVNPAHLQLSTRSANVRAMFTPMTELI